MRLRSWRGAVVPAAQIFNTGFVGTDAAALGQAQTVEAAGLCGLWTDRLLLLEPLYVRV